MRVLVCSNHAELFGGADKAFVNQLRSMHSRGVEVLGLASVAESNRGTRLLDYAGGFPMRTLPKPRLSLARAPEFLYSLRGRRAFGDAVDAFRPDIVHFHIFHGVLTSAAPALCVRRKIPYVFTAHEYRLLCPNVQMRRNDGTICEDCARRVVKWPAVVNRCVHRSALKSMLGVAECFTRDTVLGFMQHCSHFFFVSDFIREIHVRYWPQLASRSSRIYNYCEFPVAEPLGAAAALAKMVGPIVYVGRLSREKNVEFVLELALRMPERRFQIVGTGESEPWLRRCVSDRALTNVEFLGYRSSSEVRQTLDAAAFVVVPSAWYENNPLVMLEALSRGTPVLGTSYGGVPEVLNRIDSSLVFDPLSSASPDYVRDLLGKIGTETYSAISRRSLELFAELFSESTYFDSTMRVYQAILDRAKSRAARSPQESLLGSPQ